MFPKKVSFNIAPTPGLSEWGLYASFDGRARWLITAWKKDQDVIVIN